MTRTIAPALAGLFLVGLSLFSTNMLPAADEPLDFGRDIRPILSNACFECHGPDEEQREADLRLDTDSGAFAKLDDGPLLTPGKPGESQLFLRITSDDESERMPPVESEKSLSPEQIDLLRRWIEQGAKWSQHWAFIPPVRPELPGTSLQTRGTPPRAAVRERRQPSPAEPAPPIRSWEATTEASSTPIRRAPLVGPTKAAPQLRRPPTGQRLPVHCKLRRRHRQPRGKAVPSAVEGRQPGKSIRLEPVPRSRHQERRE